MHDEPAGIDVNGLLVGTAERKRCRFRCVTSRDLRIARGNSRARICNFDVQSHNPRDWSIANLVNDLMFALWSLLQPRGVLKWYSAANRPKE